MASLMANEDTLGHKRRNYNKLVNEAIKNNPSEHIPAINYEDTDMDNLFKIDIACHNRNVEYILEVLKSEDMLYVSRAIKRSTWLITDQKYSHIINPLYLKNSLRPKITSKAFNKLLLHIRLNLKNEKRVEEFFNYYYKQHDLETAFKWLLKCSVIFIENILRKHTNDIPRYMLTRLYEKSFTFFEIILKNFTNAYYIDEVLEPGMFLMKINPEEFLDILQTLRVGNINFAQKYTKVVMETNAERVLNNLEKFFEFLHIPTFARYLKPEQIKNFILFHLKNEKTRRMFTFKKMKHFLNRLPIDERFDFVHKVFIEQSWDRENIDDETWQDIVEYCNLPLKGKLSSSKNIWSWYIYASFEKAFEDLKQMIRKESNPTERLWMLRTILTCTRRDEKNVLKLLKYYHKHHFNEAAIYKIQFVNHLIDGSATHKYDHEAWGYLNGIFNSMELYIRPMARMQTCAKAIFLYNIIHDESIPKIIENNFDYDYFVKYEYREKHFSALEKEKIFNYLYKYYTSKILKDLTNENQFDESVDIIFKVLTLIDAFKKEIKDYPYILQKINDLIVINKENSWSRDLSEIYHFKKSWRRVFFSESIILCPSQESCINALNHNPELLKIYKSEINASINHEKKVSRKYYYPKYNLLFDTFFKKIRINWHRSLQNFFKITLMENINQKSSPKYFVQALCTILPGKELLEMAQKYAPKVPKIDLTQTGDLELSICKHLASNMHRARPQPPLEVVVLYAKGDYLQCVLPSLNAIFHNISPNNIFDYVESLLNTQVSLQKHGIRVLLSKLNHMNYKNVFSRLAGTWKSCKNRTLRKVIFCETFKALCRESDEAVILEKWLCLSALIDTLTVQENKKIYLTLSQVEHVPLSVRAEFWMKCFEFLKKLPPKANGQKLIENLNKNLNDIMEFLKTDFMEKLFLDNFDENFTTREYDYRPQLAIYVMSTRSECNQHERYKKILIPVMEKAIFHWNTQHNNVYFARKNLHDIFLSMFQEFENLVLLKGMVFPISMYADALNTLQRNLSIKENYGLLTDAKLSLGYIKILYELQADCSGLKETENCGSDKNDEIINLHKNAAPIFGRLCVDFLKEDVANNFQSIYIIFGEVLNTIFKRWEHVCKLGVLKSILHSNDLIESHLLVTYMIINYIYDEEEKRELLKELSTHPSEQVAMHYWFIVSTKDL